MLTTITKPYDTPAASTIDASADTSDAVSSADTSANLDSDTRTAVDHVFDDPLHFTPITLEALHEIAPIINREGAMSCDYTIGGIYMWIRYLRYEYCIVDDTLFIKGLSEKDDATPAFSLPIGPMLLDRAIALIRRHCERNGLTMRFSAIPFDRVPQFLEVADFTVTELPDLADYIYNIEALASLSGKKLSKKRNHVNRFFSDHPTASLIPITAADADQLIAAYDEWTSANPLTMTTAIEEAEMTRRVLRHLDRYPFVGAKLTDGEGHIVAFTVAEIEGDTLHVHIEKMDHRVSGAGETINQMFAHFMLLMLPRLQYINRQDDAGDEGLRQAKLSYHPAMLLRKFELTL